MAGRTVRTYGAREQATTTTNTNKTCGGGGGGGRRGRATDRRWCRARRDIRPCSVLHNDKKTVVGGEGGYSCSQMSAGNSPLRPRPRKRRKMQGRKRRKKRRKGMEAQPASSSAPTRTPQLPPPPWSSPYTVVEHRVRSWRWKICSASLHRESSTVVPKKQCSRDTGPAQNLWVGSSICESNRANLACVLACVRRAAEERGGV